MLSFYGGGGGGSYWLHDVAQQPAEEIFQACNSL